MHFLTLSLAIAGLLAQERLAGADVPSSMVSKRPAAGSTVLKVDGQEIKSDEIEALLWDWRREEVIQDLIDDRVVRNVAKKANLTVDDKEIEKAYAEMLEGMKEGLPPGKTVEQALAEQGATRSRMWIRVRTELYLKKLILIDFKAADFVKISTINIKPISQSTEDVKAAIEKADTAFKRLKANESWSDVYLSVTDDPRARATLGLVGWRGINAFPESVKQEVLASKRGDITKPSQTVNGIQIFKVEALGKDASGDDLNELESAFYAGKRNATLMAYRVAAKIERD